MANKTSLAAGIGIENLKRAITSVFLNLKLDKDGDGKISRSEWVSGLLNLIPTLFNYEDLAIEARDLDKNEIKELIDHVGKSFPDYAGIPNEVEALIREIVALISQIYTVVRAFGTINPATKAPVK